jgi:dTDP-4-amino-4,6-dideoxygalactose transaminase
VIVAAGAKPVFVDTATDLNIDPDRIEEKVTAKTRAIIPVHLTGRPAAMDQISGIARKYGLHVIEDAAQAIGAEYKGKKVGSFGATGCFSLHPLKTLNACGDAGAITTSSVKLRQTLMQMRNIGLKNRDESDIWGYNSRLDTVQAAILLVKFKYLNAWTEERRKKARYYLEHLRGIVVLPEERKYEKCVYHTFVIQAEQRDKLKSYLEQQGIGTRIHYPIPLHLQKACRSFKFKKGDFPVCEKQAGLILSLPLYHGLTEENQARIVKKIKQYYGS